MRIKITAGGIYGQPTKENPSGELPVGTELKVEKAPLGWAGRYIDLDADAPADGEDIDALKARIAELEAENAQLKKGSNAKPNDQPSERDALKARATELKIEFAGNIATAKLKELVEAKEAEPKTKPFEDMPDDELKAFLAEKNVAVADETREQLLELAKAA